ncbi:MAG: SpoVT / AbrB like domain protein [Candidatus Bathyarchaeota archaeon BA1]|nr:MAG: SpoVT / AbrB like domain protein [Candidatus Bathyarchaeota archaeon BA1]
MISVVEVLEKLVKTKLDERGRIYIPKEVRERLFIKQGDILYIELEGDCFTVYTGKAIVKRLTRFSS